MANEVEQVKAQYALIIGLVGLLGIFAIILIMAFRTLQTPSSDIVAIVGTITGLVGTIVGAFLGVQVGSTDKQNIQNQLNRSLAALPKDDANRVLSEET